MVEKQITDDLEALLQTLPPHLQQPLLQRSDRSELLEVVLDLGRRPEARFPHEEVVLDESEVSHGDIDYVVSRIGSFGDDNRAGIERTLHRFSAMRNRNGRVVGLTCRVGRAVFGSMALIRDLVESGKSILLLGRPGVGKTTMLREVARVLADDMKKRVVIVDTSNEIAGDGDIPHPAIGHARRMQVTTPSLQHAVMIEAVENHMPEVIIIDEMGNELEAAAARTIAERGVQLVATAHGNTLQNLIMNPTLSDLIGGIQSVTLGDEEARRRGTQKSILERKAPPTFDIVVEIQNWERVAVHPNVTATVDAILRRRSIPPEERWMDAEGQVQKERPSPAQGPISTEPRPMPVPAADRSSRIYPFGVNRSRLEDAVKKMGLPISLVNNFREADIIMTTKTYYRKRPQTLRAAEAEGIPMFVLRRSSMSQIEQSLRTMYGLDRPSDSVNTAIREAQDAVEEIFKGAESVELSHQSSFIRRLQHQIAERSNLLSNSRGKEPFRRVNMFRSVDNPNGN
ncbi:MAG: R3H domain-containing nucleic acid-binding protein [Dehalococcoidia bacterium]